MQVAFDHAVVVVPSLDDAVQRYAAAGFVVRPGGRHDALPSANALVVLADGGYLELLAPRDEEADQSLRMRSRRPGWAAELRRGPAIGRRFLPRLVGPPGVRDLALRATGLARFAAESRRRGFVMTGPVTMTRERPDGVRLEWTLVLPAADGLPMLIEDLTPREWRVPPDPAACAHANRAGAVAEVTVQTADVAWTALAYADLLGAHPLARADGSTSLEVAGIGVRIVEGAPEGAVGLTLRGVGGLPTDVERDGVRGERAADAPPAGAPG